MDVNRTYCPSCNGEIFKNIKRQLIFKGKIECPHCKASLTTSISSSLFFAIIVGGPVYALTKYLLGFIEINNYLESFIPVFLILLTSQLLSPFKNLVEVE
ncbi:hypothetical protein [Opacimonas viscosa]|uniref:Cxxc_20_cxxc protein n=1 Tax=Opacimonas viscosa TaxID=2961944 RepID=A0AA41X4X8_9ALTE|nr:hypothetical protein [Opacimonas viscosa]MCP3429561.1 hypothetical protein [Opacimonas viscosa]